MVFGCGIRALTDKLLLQGRQSVTEAFVCPCLLLKARMFAVSGVLAAPAPQVAAAGDPTCPRLCQSLSMVLWEAGHWAVRKYH